MAIKIPRGLVIFTDLDGTLLDHESYDFAPARPMLARLAMAGVPVVLASSKTAAEIALWQERMGLTGWPAIVENGAGISAGTDDPDAGEQPTYPRLCRAIAAARVPFRGFATMTDADLAALTGLPLGEARLARQRAWSEPGLWQGDAAGLAAFLAKMAAEGITARRGGRFLTLSYGGTKAARMAELAERLNARLTVALGDAPNDAEMIAAASRGIVVRNDHGPGLPPLPGESTGRILRSRTAGPTGWAEALDTLLSGIAG